jgi:hypothetical protein
VEQDDSLLWSIALRCSVQHVNQAHQGDVQAEDRVFPVLDWIFEERITNQPLLVVDVFLFAVRDYHVVKALERVARNLRFVSNDLKVLFEGAFPV